MPYTVDSDKYQIAVPPQTASIPKLAFFVCPGTESVDFAASGEIHDACTAHPALLSPTFYEKAERVLQPFNCLTQFRIFTFRPAFPLVFGSMRVSAADKCGVSPAFPLTSPVRQRVIGDSELFRGFSHAHIVGQTYRVFLKLFVICRCHCYSTPSFFDFISFFSIFRFHLYRGGSICPWFHKLCCPGCLPEQHEPGYSGSADISKAAIRSDARFHKTWCGCGL